jgi:microsomal dipeptidase-like Zn-dependent dipeptidase
MRQFQYSDLHCHPNLKAFGHNFDKKKTKRSNMWWEKSPSYLTRIIHRLTGITKFSQASFTSIAKGNGKIIFLSLYPFEKGFFNYPRIFLRLGAFIANWAIEIGYKRVRSIQRHSNYFEDLLNEYDFVLRSDRRIEIDGVMHQWTLTHNWQEVKEVIQVDNSIAVIITIEGSHVFNCGLGNFGLDTQEKEVLNNIGKVKQWEFPPLFIGLAHNFNNDLCGHAESLQRLGKAVNQSKHMGEGIFDFGRKVIRALLDDKNGRSIYIDLKHMSKLARQQYLQILEEDYYDRNIPIIVSHGSVTGRSWDSARSNTMCHDIFNENEINFYDEEILAIAKSNGLFALQLDISIHVDFKKLNKNLPGAADETQLQTSAKIIWNQLQHIAFILDENNLFAWGTAAIGSDFDGSINPFPGILTARDLGLLAEELARMADQFLVQQKMTVPCNREITGENIIDLLMIGNAERFLTQFFN